MSLLFHENRAMIHIVDQSLSFSFPAIDAELRALLSHAIEDRLEEAWRSFPDLCREELAELRGDDQLDREQVEKAEVALGAVDHEQYARVFREKAVLASGIVRGSGSVAEIEIGFQRTLRVPDDGNDYPLPAGLGPFALRSIDQFAGRAPESWLARGGALIPMYQAEAMWINFSGSFPCAVQMKTGSVDALTGQKPSDELVADPQNYMVPPSQPWLDGFKVDKDTVRQFVAAPIGNGVTVSEQLAPEESAEGLELSVTPMRASYFFREKVEPELRSIEADVLRAFLAEEIRTSQLVREDGDRHYCLYARSIDPAALGLGAGGRIRQEIYEDPYGEEAWDTDLTEGVAVQICDAISWTKLSGELPPQKPITAKTYSRMGIPWFLYYRTDLDALKATPELAEIVSVKDAGGLLNESDDGEQSIWDVLGTGIDHTAVAPVEIRGVT